MSENSAIEWTDHTFNPWWGCTKVSEGCRNCYAEGVSNRFSPGHWGPRGERRFFGDRHWNEPLRWDRMAAGASERHRVFCASMADVFEDRSDLDGQRARLWSLIESTPNLDWLLLTKRPDLVRVFTPRQWTRETLTPGDGVAWPANVWLGTSAEDQATADERIPHLLRCPAAVRFLSAEPLLGPLRIGTWVGCGDPAHRHSGPCSLYGADRRLQWVIVGGESGPGARPMHPAWARSLRDQCVEARVPFFFKQWGAWAPHTPRAGGDLGGDVRAGRVRIVHPTGESDVDVFTRTRGRNTVPGSRYMARVGKKAAGRLLDGREWDEMPEGVA